MNASSLQEGTWRLSCYCSLEQYITCASNLWVSGGKTISPGAARLEGVLELVACPCHPAHALVHAFWPCLTPFWDSESASFAPSTPHSGTASTGSKEGYQQPVGHLACLPPTMHLIRHAIALQFVLAWLPTTTGRAWRLHFLHSTPYAWPQPLLIDTPSTRAAIQQAGGPCPSNVSIRADGSISQASLLPGCTQLLSISTSACSGVDP